MARRKVVQLPAAENLTNRVQSFIVRCMHNTTHTNLQLQTNRQGLEQRKTNTGNAGNCALLLLLFEELGDGGLLGVCCCLDLLASAKGVVAADARVPWAILVGPPAASQLPLALLPDARAAIRAGDLREPHVPQVETDELFERDK